MRNRIDWYFFHSAGKTIFHFRVICTFLGKQICSPFVKSKDKQQQNYFERERLRTFHIKQKKTLTTYISAFASFTKFCLFRFKKNWCFRKQHWCFSGVLWYDNSKVLKTTNYLDEERILFLKPKISNSHYQPEHDRNSSDNKT